MKTKIFTRKNLIILLAMGTLAAVIFSCAETKTIKEKSGAQLWAENCQRCHNTPSPTSFSTEQWKTIGLHMQSKALISDKERDKIFTFLGATH